jgi:hypothetical protein
VCFIFFIITPFTKELENNFSAIQVKLIEAKNNGDKINKVGTMEDSFNQVVGELSSLEVIFSKDNIVELVRELESIAQSTGNTITISVDEKSSGVVAVDKNKDKKNPKEKEDAFLQALPVQSYFLIKIKLTGDYGGLIKFINKLNNVKYYNTPISFDIASQEIVLENNNKGDKPSGGISLMNGDRGDNLTQIELKKIILISNLNVIFYSLENQEGKK